jgi:hypothetical protein
MLQERGGKPIGNQSSETIAILECYLSMARGLSFEQRNAELSPLMIGSSN